jgi:bifunctional UDP-N-acetylglucosamine pyrophosphorylase/glucosamine-1-phosphate N-acetyltransferase
VQGEIYVTDLIKIFNDHGLCVQSFPVENNDYVVAFNVKSVLKQMEVTFRSMVYDKLKDLVTIDDADDFYIAEETVERIIDMDNKTGALDIRIGKGASIGKDIHFGQGLEVNKNAQLSGNVRIGKNVSIGENVVISTFPGQCIEIGDGTRIFSGNILKGNVKLGRNAQVESGVRITGSDEWPVVIGNNVLIKGMTYIFGSVIEDDLLIVHSIVEKQYVERVVKKSGEIQPIKYILPHPEGLDSIRNLKTDTDYEDC